MRNNVVSSRDRSLINTDQKRVVYATIHFKDGTVLGMSEEKFRRTSLIGKLDNIYLFIVFNYEGGNYKVLSDHDFKGTN